MQREESSFHSTALLILHIGMFTRAKKQNYHTLAYFITTGIKNAEVNKIKKRLISILSTEGWGMNGIFHSNFFLLDFHIVMSWILICVKLHECIEKLAKYSKLSGIFHSTAPLILHIRMFIFVKQKCLLCNSKWDFRSPEFFSLFFYVENSCERTCVYLNWKTFPSAYFIFELYKYSIHWCFDKYEVEIE